MTANIREKGDMIVLIKCLLHHDNTPEKTTTKYFNWKLSFFTAIKIRRLHNFYQLIDHNDIDKLIGLSS